MKWLFAFVLLQATASAHKPSDSYMRLGAPLSRDGAIVLALRWDVALRDLDRALGLDANRDGKITWAEVRSADTATRKLLTSKISASLGGEACSFIANEGDPQIARHSDGAYVVYALSFVCPKLGTSLAMSYGFLFDLDPAHRGLLRTGDEVTIFSRDARTLDVALPNAPPHDFRLWSAVRQGVHHIWTGYDHMLFLLALLLPAVLRREQGRWVPVEKLSSALGDVLKVVTAFTLAHSVTLSLAALGALALPSKIVESAIALSVVLAALNNLWPVVRGDRWLAAFALGLLHGFGFSSTLADLGLDSRTLIPTLVGFNLGVELGQATIVAIFVPLAFAARKTTAYRRGLLQIGSAIIAVIATIWLYERIAGVVILPFLR